MRSLFYFLPLFRKLLGPILLSLGLSVATLAAGIGLLGVSGWFLTAAALSSAGVAFNLFGPSAGVRGLSFARILSRYGEKITGHDATLRLLSDLRRWVFERLFRLIPLGRRFGRADLVSRLIADLDALDTLFLVALGPISTAAVVGIAVTVLLSFLLPVAAAIYAACSFTAIVIVPVVLIVSSRQPAAVAAEASAALRQATLDGIDGHFDLVVFDDIDAASGRAAAAAARLALAKRQLGVRASLASLSVQLLSALILVGTLMSGLPAIREGSIEGPLFVGVLLAVVASFEATAVLVRSATRLVGSLAAADRLAAIAEAPVAIDEPAAPVALPAGGELAFVGVDFGYDDRANVLTGASFRIESGECVSIRGPSGAGKSTIGQLLVRLIEPQAGTILINGVDIATVRTAELRRRLALMTQDAPVFNDTVRANLLIGRPDASTAELWRELEAVGLGETIRTLPGGLDAVLGEAGRTLSAGQARRICLARTLLSQASIIVLDEPTSGLDAESEAKFLADLPGAAMGRTMVVISHADVPRTFSRVLGVRAGRIEG